MKKLYKYLAIDRTFGKIEGLFIAEEKDIKDNIGNLVYFEDYFEEDQTHFVFEENHLKIVSEDQDFINALFKIFKNKTIMGYNPLSNIYHNYITY